MAALFPPWSNTAFRVVLVLILLIGLAVIVVPMIYVRTPYQSFEGYPVTQPVEFDHRHHVRDDGIPCLYCHSAAETSPSAGIPSTDLCMGCHAQIWNQSPLLEPVRQSYFSGVPIPWNRVHRLPDFTYFHHGIHVQSGIECTACHGRVDLMARVYRVVPMHMSWCLDCHRERGRGTMLPGSTPPLFGLTGEVYEPAFAPIPSGQPISRLDTCSACHR